MACVPIPTPPEPPALPDGITLAPTLPAPDLSQDFCCKLIDLPDIPPLPPLPVGVVNPGLAAAIETLLDQILAHVRGLPLNCPRE